MSASTFNNGTGCLFGGDWSPWTGQIVPPNGIQADTVFVPVCSCSGQTYSIKLAVKNDIDVENVPNQQYYVFGVEAYNYTLIGGDSNVNGTTSIGGNFEPGTYSEVTIDNLQAFSEIDLESIKINYGASESETLTINGGPGIYGHVATAYLYRNQHQYGTASHSTRVPFASTQGGLALTVVITKQTT